MGGEEKEITYFTKKTVKDIGFNNLAESTIFSRGLFELTDCNIKMQDDKVPYPVSVSLWSQWREHTRDLPWKIHDTTVEKGFVEVATVDDVLIFLETQLAKAQLAKAQLAKAQLAKEQLISYKKLIPVVKCLRDLAVAFKLPFNTMPTMPTMPDKKVSEETKQALMPDPVVSGGGGNMKKTNVTKRVMGRDRIIYKGKHGKEYVKSKGAFVAVAKV
jgi:hypothetical protein